MSRTVDNVPGTSEKTAQGQTVRINAAPSGERSTHYVNPSIDSCRVCGGERHTVIDREVVNGLTFTIARCEDCSLIYVRERYCDLSPDYIHLEPRDMDENRIWGQGRHKEKTFRQCLDLASHLLSLPSREQDEFKPRILDVGCATGGFLNIAQDDYDCYGFDASPAQADYAKRYFPNVRNAIGFSDYLTKIHHAPDSFHLITMWDVLEHIRDPIPFLKDISQGLAPGGVFFAAVPAATPMLIKRRVRWIWPGFTWSPHEHVAYYSPSTLSTLLERAGLKVLRVFSVKAYPRDPTLFEALRRLGFALTTFIAGLAPQIGIFAHKPEK